jgi:phage-related protein
MDVFQLLGTIAINNQNAINALNQTSAAGNDAESKLSGAFKKIGGAAVAVGKAVGAAMVAGGVAVTGLVTKSVQAYADYEQLEGGVQTLFGAGGRSLEEYAKSVGKSVDAASAEYEKLMRAQETVIDNADKAYMTAGMSANEYMETVTGFSAALIASVGGDTEKAAEKANQALIDMSDNANKMGSNMEDIKNAYGGFAKQNYTMLDNLKLGYGGTQTEMQRLLKDAQAISGVEYDISSYADVVDAIHVIQTEMDITGTTAKEASTTISGSLGMVKAQWENVLTAMSADGWDLGVYIANFVDTVEIAVKNLLPVISTALMGVVQLVDQVAPILIEKIPEILSQLLPVVIEAITGLITSIVDIFPGLINTLTDILPALIAGVQNIINALISALPQIMQALAAALPTLIPMLIDALISMIVTLATNLPLIIQPIIDNLPLIIMSIVTALLDNLPALIQGAVALIVGLVNAIPQIVVPLVEMMPEIITMLVVAIVNSAPLLIDAFVQIWNSINIAIDNVVNAIIDLVGKLWQWCVDYVKPVLENYKQIINNAWNAIKTSISNAIGAVKNAVVNAWNNIANSTNNAWNTVKNGIQNAWSSVKSAVSNATNSVKNTISGAWNSVKSATSSGWNAIKTAIQTPIEKARDLVKSAIDKMKSFFNFSWELPKLKLPHFSMSGSFSLNQPSVPKFGIEWYAKAMENPMLMESPTVFGYNPQSGSLMAGGEAGSEVVSGTDKLMTMISQAVAAQNDGVTYYLQQLIQMIAEYMPQLLNASNKAVVLDTGVMVGQIAAPMNAALGKIKERKERGR